MRTPTAAHNGLKASSDEYHGTSGLGFRFSRPVVQVLDATIHLKADSLYSDITDDHDTLDSGLWLWLCALPTVFASWKGYTAVDGRPCPAQSNPASIGLGHKTPRRRT